jgi:hypothetical protein
VEVFASPSWCNPPINDDSVDFLGLKSFAAAREFSLAIVLRQGRKFAHRRWWDSGLIEVDSEFLYLS